jgi:hypothetical protein
MSRKTAVCLLFVFCWALVGTALPARAMAGFIGNPPSSGATGPTHLVMGDAKVGDPDGLVASSPFAPGGLVPELVRFLVRSLIL